MSDMLYQHIQLAEGDGGFYVVDEIKEIVLSGPLTLIDAIKSKKKIIDLLILSSFQS